LYFAGQIIEFYSDVIQNWSDNKVNNLPILLKPMVNKTINKLNQHSLFITGYTAGMKLEHRVFNMMCIIAIILITFSIPFSLWIGLKMTSLLLTVMLIGLYAVFHLARFRQKFNLAIILVSTFIPTVLAANFFFSGGIWGTTLPSIVLTFFLIMIVIPRKLSWILAFFCLVTCFVLTWTEYHYPHFVTSTFANEESKFFDMTYTTIISVIVIYAGITYLKNAYYAEKIRADRRAMELELLNSEKSKLFSIISHDLRAPLASIQNYLHLLKSYSISTSERLAMEQKLTDTVNGTQEMLDNLLHWSTSELGKAHTQLKENDLNEMLLPLMNLQQTAALEKGIQLNWKLNIKCKVLSDSNMLQLVLRNLISNAIKFTKSGCTVQINAEERDGQCLITVTDNGIGIPLSQQAEIFSLNSQSTYGTANEKGIGLGLYLCREYTTLQNGKIWYESIPDVGTTFYVALPLAKNNL